MIMISMMRQKFPFEPTVGNEQGDSRSRICFKHDEMKICIKFKNKYYSVSLATSSVKGEEINIFSVSEESSLKTD